MTRTTIGFFLLGSFALLLASPATAQVEPQPVPIPIERWVGDWVDDDPPQLVVGYGLTEEEDAERIRRKVQQRRVQMNLHQVLSIALIPTLGATAVMGTINRARIDLGIPITPADLAVHRGLAIGSTALYTTTGLLAATAPRPLRDLVGTSGISEGFDSSRVHRALAVVHASVFVALLVTGIVDAWAPLSPEAYDVISRVHVIEGWTVFTLVTVSGIVIGRF